MQKKGGNQKAEVIYKKADKITWETIKDELPEEVIPTKKIHYIFGGILLLIIIINIATFPWMNMMRPESFDNGLSIELGWPMFFFSMDLSNPDAMPIKIIGLIVDMIVIYFLAYLVEVALNYLIQTDVVQRMMGNGAYVDAKPKVVTPKRI